MPLHLQNHKPLAFLSGRFSGASSRWPIPDKEAFAIVESCKRLEYILLRPQGFVIHTDHRNLAYLFNPTATDSKMQRHQADRLLRWAMTLSGYRYTIVHIPGHTNTWADMISRWHCSAKHNLTPDPAAALRGPNSRTRHTNAKNDTSAIDHTPHSSQSHPPLSSTKASVNAITIPPAAPLNAANFQWPSWVDIDQAQKPFRSNSHGAGPPPDVTWNASTRCFCDGKGRIWIPPNATDLKTRLCVVAHAGLSGHRGTQATFQPLKELYVWQGMESDVIAFCRRCLQCLTVRGNIIPRPLGTQLHATRPNELLHFDYLTLPLDRATNDNYILVIKDDASGFCLLHPCQAATAENCASALCHWFSLFGIVKTWVTDRGAHFKNEVISALSQALSTQHHFSTAYSPWSNGTIEVLNRQLLRCVITMMIERQLQPNQWSCLVPAVQTALIHMPSDRIGGRAPVTAFTGLPAMSPIMATIAGTFEVLAMSTDDMSEDLTNHLNATALALTNMHREMAKSSDSRRMQAQSRRSRRSTPPCFSIGDFVLVGVVCQHLPKLALQWRGPKLIVEALSEWIYVVEDIAEPKTRSTHHASRLCLFAESKFMATEDIVNYARYTDGGHCVRSITQMRTNDTAYDLLVNWIGLEDIESTWEPI
ncbi:hypothetical protein Ae201684P_020445 [Aphanomyces euteiches]|uniref:Integrase catalytic domain-containing protein n=1 Tax=Aphanomyces euteiches TaxID=100861 RepID=A0A6G0WFN0_9STRA|nr:hypothetical protein Ae201684_015586 [Aphanomyces euteiches]KAH9084193.1 hypothetical protein Ae201684P_020445 [Aphanomyces euteiches]